MGSLLSDLTRGFRSVADVDAWFLMASEEKVWDGGQTTAFSSVLTGSICFAVEGFASWFASVAAERDAAATTFSRTGHPGSYQCS